MTLFQISISSAKERNSMTELIITAALGVFVSVLGIINMTGNISTLHWYHRKRVTEENRKPFGKRVGLGTLIIGVSLILFSLLHFIFELTLLAPLVVAGAIELIIGGVIGIAISFYAMIKYNGGIF